MIRNLAKNKFDVQKYIYDVPNFPKKGIVFKDITPLLNNSKAFHYVINQMARFVKQTKADVVIAPEARGFIFGGAVAYKAGTRFVPIRKPGKLPRDTRSEAYQLEYGSSQLEMHVDSLKKHDRVVIVDDVLGTGGTLEALSKLVNDSGAKVVGISVVIDLTSLHGPEVLANKKVQTLIKY